MAEITFNLSCGKADTIYKGGATFTASMTRNSAPPVGAYPVSADIRFTNIRVWSNREPYLKFGDYFTTAGQPNTSGEFLQVNVDSFSSSILDVSSASIEVTVKGVGSAVNAFDFNSTAATLVVQYEISHSGSTVSLSSPSITAGNAMTVSFSNANLSSVYHKVTWAFGGHSKTNTTSTGATSTSYTIPVSWIDEIPNSTSGYGLVTAETYSSDGTFVGTSSYKFTLNVPSSVVPSVGSITAARINNEVPASWGIYVQNISGVTLTANSAAGSYGSTISSYKFSGAATSTQTSNMFTLQTIPSSGTQTFSVQVTDSRGRTSNTVSCSISVAVYTPPSFSTAVAFRCTSNGTSNEEGTYIGTRATATYSSMSGKNSVSVSCSYQKVGATSWTTGQSSMTLGSTYVIGSGNIDTNYSYQVKFTLKDTFRTIERIVDVSTTLYTMFFKKGGTGVGIGKACEHEYALELNPAWSFYYGNVDLIAKINQAAGITVPNIVYSPSQPSGTTGMIWLKPKS